MENSNKQVFKYKVTLGSGSSYMYEGTPESVARHLAAQELGTHVEIIKPVEPKS